MALGASAGADGRGDPGGGRVRPRHPDGVSTHTALLGGAIWGVYPPLATRRLSTGFSEAWLIKVM